MINVQSTHFITNVNKEQPFPREENEGIQYVLVGKIDRQTSECLHSYPDIKSPFIKGAYKFRFLK